MHGDAAEKMQFHPHGLYFSTSSSHDGALPFFLLFLFFEFRFGRYRSSKSADRYTSTLLHLAATSPYTTSSPARLIDFALVSEVTSSAPPKAKMPLRKSASRVFDHPPSDVARSHPDAERSREKSRPEPLANQRRPRCWPALP
jgi:hypothetical protein